MFMEIQRVRSSYPEQQKDIIIGGGGGGGGVHGGFTHGPNNHQTLNIGFS